MTTHLFVPPSMRRLDATRLPSGPGLRHAALEYDLVAELRPRLLVALGTGNATSFFAACEAMIDHDVDGTCYAIDAWAAEPSADGGGLDAIRAHGRRHYPGITYFVSMAPPDALRHFDAATIDVLRVDATRPDVISDAHVDPWLERLRPGGILAWSGVAARPELFARVQASCATVVFPDDRGDLGLARKNGPPPTTEILRLLFVENEREGLAALYATAHEHLELAKVMDRTTKAKG